MGKSWRGVMERRALLDTNVVIDFLDSARPHHETAVDLLGVLIQLGAAVCVPASSLTDVYYVLRRTAGEPAARRAVGALVEALRVVAVDADICRAALASDEPDFEDGVVRACAESISAHWLVTRDQTAFAHAPVATVTPADLLARLTAPGTPGQPRKMLSEI